MKTGLVLEGGALRGVFTSGVCDAMMEGGLSVDYLLGVSAGIANGVSFASNQPRRSLEVLTRFVNDKRYMGLNNLAHRDNRSYFGLEFAYETIPNKLVPFDYDAFAAFPGEVEAVVTDLVTGKPAYLDVPRRDKRNTVVQASCALPLMFPTYHINGHMYQDGGIADSIPWKRAFERGCDRVVVVLTRTREYEKKPDKLLPLLQKRYGKYPGFVEAAATRHSRYNKCREELFALEREGKALVIAPEDTLGVSRTERDVDKLRLLWGEGYQQTVECLDQLKDYLGG